MPSHLLVQNPGGMLHGVESVIPLTHVNIQVLHGHSIMPPHPSGVGPQSESVLHVVGAQSVVVDVDVVVVVVVVVSQTWAAVHIANLTGRAGAAVQRGEGDGTCLTRGSCRSGRPLPHMWWACSRPQPASCPAVNC